MRPGGEDKPVAPKWPKSHCREEGSPGSLRKRTLWNILITPTTSVLWLPMGSSSVGSGMRQPRDPTRSSVSQLVIPIFLGVGAGSTHLGSRVQAWRNDLEAGSGTGACDTEVGERWPHSLMRTPSPCQPPCTPPEHSQGAPQTFFQGWTRVSPRDLWHAAQGKKVLEGGRGLQGLKASGPTQ